MSMLTSEIANLRLMARLVREYDYAEISRMLREAADTIETLRERAQEANERIAELEAELGRSNDALNRAAGKWAKADATCRELEEELADEKREHGWMREFLDRMGRRCGTADCPSLVAYVGQLEGLVRDFCKLVPRLDFPTNELDDAACQLICKADKALGLEA